MECTSSVIDFLHCDIYVCRNDQQTCSQLVTDHDELQSWQTKLFAFIHDNTRGYVWNREPLVVSVNNTNKGKDSGAKRICLTIALTQKKTPQVVLFLHMCSALCVWPDDTWGRCG